MRSRLALTLAGIVALAALLLPPLARDRLTPSDAVLWQTLALQLGWCGLAALFAALVGGSPTERLGLVRGGLTPARLALGALGTLALSGALQFAIDALGLAPGTALERLDSIARASATQSPGLVLAAFGIAPGIGEELLFRGAIQRSLGRRLGGWCVPLAALAFGALHADSVHSPAAFVLGCYLGALAYLTGNTWLPIACHVLNNCAAALPQLVSGASAALPRPEDWPQAALWLALSAVALALIARSTRDSRRAPSAASD